MSMAPGRMWKCLRLPVPGFASSQLGVSDSPTHSPALNGAVPQRKLSARVQPAGRQPAGPPDSSPLTRRHSAANMTGSVRRNCWMVSSLRVYRVITDTPAPECLS